jgi:hypothetical protein
VGGDRGSDAPDAAVAEEGNKRLSNTQLATSNITWAHRQPASLPALCPQTRFAPAPQLPQVGCVGEEDPSHSFRFLVVCCESLCYPDVK